MFHRI
jgi:hypothetical protein